MKINDEIPESCEGSLAPHPLPHPFDYKLAKTKSFILSW